MDGCINYPSFGSIWVSTISMPSNCSSYPTSFHVKDRGTRRRQRERRERWYRVLFRHQTQNTFMCLSTDQLKFLDMTNYIATGFSFDNGGEDTKGHFRSFTETGLLQSSEERRYFRRGLRHLPSGVAPEWHEGIARLSRLVQQSGCGSLSAAIHIPFAFYQQSGIDMSKIGISVPGLSLLYLFNDLPEKTYFTLFNEKNKDLHHLVKDHVVGGASLIFHHCQEKGVTNLC